MPSVSVVIPTYNRWPLICRAVDSVLSQTVKPDEIIVVDDGSEDNTHSHLLQRYGKKINLLQQTNSGVSAARNAGIDKATGDWIALLDSDDEWLSKKLQTQLQTLRDNPACVLCHTNEIWIRNGVRVNQMNKHQKSGGDIFSQCLPLCAISPSSVLLQKKLFASVGMFDEALPACEDYDLWLRICAQYPVHYLDQPLLKKYGGHEDQLSRKYWGMDRFRIKALSKLLTIELTEIQKEQTRSMLEQKLSILLKGAIKHQNQELIDECNTMLLQHQLNFQNASQ